jgi:hypothetical protein
MGCSEIARAHPTSLSRPAAAFLSDCRLKKRWIAVGWLAVTPINDFNLTGLRSNNDYNGHSIRRWMPR